MSRPAPPVWRSILYVPGNASGKMIDIPAIDRARCLVARHEAMERRQRA